MGCPSWIVPKHNLAGGAQSRVLAHSILQMCHAEKNVIGSDPLVQFVPNGRTNHEMGASSNVSGLLIADVPCVRRWYRPIFLGNRPAYLDRLVPVLV